MGKSNLTPKQKAFCEEYLIDLNGTQSAIRAGYSKKTARQTASEYLAKPNIQDFISELKEKRNQRTQITSDMVLTEIAKVAFLKESDFYKDNGEVKALSELGDDQKSALSSYGFKSVSIGEGKYEDVPVFKSQDKMKALELLGKHVGIFEKDNKQKAPKIENKVTWSLVD